MSATITFELKEFDSILTTIQQLDARISQIDDKLNQLLVAASLDAPARFIRITEVQRRVGYGKSTIYRLIKEGEFPAPYGRGHASLWLESEVTEWQQQVIAAGKSG